jgi:hypothetical protein
MVGVVPGDGCRVVENGNGVFERDSVILATGTASQRLASRGTRIVRTAKILMDHFIAYVLFVSFLATASWCVAKFVLSVGGMTATIPLVPSSFWRELIRSLDAWCLVALAANAFIVFVFSSRFGTNSSSMHSFYQGRVTRAFLNEFLAGAEHIRSIKNVEVTTIAELRNKKSGPFIGPYFLFNATMNVTRRDDTSFQQCQAANFLFSSLYYGYHLPADADQHVDRSWYLSSDDVDFGHHKGIRLGQAMAISASAIGANMGMYTSPKARFLNALLNLRLGWWFPNPRFPDNASRPYSWWRIHLLWQELMGKTNATSKFVHLSDGGHFENLGIYELLRRRCHIIVASDASEDGELKFGSLAGAIHLARVDLRVEIDFNAGAAEQVNRDGFTFVDIIYPDRPRGILLYIKPVVVGSTPSDVLTFQRIHKEFPHDSTTDQWFGESQFESYRVLGLKITEAVGKLIISKRGEGLAAKIQAQPDSTDPPIAEAC